MSGKFRTEFLKGYVLSLISEGALKGAKSPADAVKRVVAHFSSDVTTVVTEIVSVAAINGLDELRRRASSVHEKLGEKIGEVVARVRERGFGEFWKDMQATYAAGVEANAKHRGG